MLFETRPHGKADKARSERVALFLIGLGLGLGLGVRGTGCGVRGAGCGVRGATHQLNRGFLALPTRGRIAATQSPRRQFCDPIEPS